MKKSDLFLSFLLGISAFASRIFLIEKVQSHWDGPQYSIGVVRYSFGQFTPAPPGYPLYIAMGKFFYIFVKDPHLAILLVSVFATITGSVLLYLIGKNLYNRYVGLTSSIIFLTGSTFYYFGLTPYAYVTIPITTTLLAFIVYQIYMRHKQMGFWLGLTFGISFGIRPQEIIFTFPILGLGFIYLSNKEKIKSLVVFLVISLAWLIPLLSVIGPVNFFIQSLEFLKTAAYQASLSQRLELIMKGFLLSFGLSSILLLYYVWILFNNYQNIIKKNIKIIIFYFLWLTPGLLYNIFLRVDHAGYQMSYLAAFLLLISYSLWKITEKNKKLYFVIILLIALFNLYWFFYNRDPQFIKSYRPTSFHYSDIRKNDLKTGSKINFIMSKFDPNKTLVITNSVLWRPYGYYLKKYLVISLDGLADNNPGSLYLERNQKDWDMKQFQNKSLTLTIPKDIDSIIMPDDENYAWIRNYPYKIFNLPGNSKITLISVNPGDKIVYKFHYFTIFKTN